MLFFAYSVGFGVSSVTTFLQIYPYVLQKCCNDSFLNCINARKPFVFKGFRAFVSRFVLFPLDRAAGLGGEVVQDSVYALYLVCDTGGYFMKHIVRYFLDRGGHCVRCIYRADDIGPALIPFTVTHADGSEVGDCYKILPYLI